LFVPVARLGGGGKLVSTVAGRGGFAGAGASREVDANALMLDNVGDEVEDGDEVRCTGLRATGGGAFFDEELVVVEVERRRLEGG
jgi:hypothetical protein